MLESDAITSCDTVADRLATALSSSRRGRRHALTAPGIRGSRLPAGLALSLVESFTRPGDIVLDAFCDHPAAITQATWTGRLASSIATDELAFAMTKAALDPPATREVVKRVRELQSDLFYGDPGEAPKAARDRFSPEALSHVVHLRSLLDITYPIDACLALWTCEWLETDFPPSLDIDIFDSLIARATRQLEGTPTIAEAPRLWTSRDRRSALAAMRVERPVLIFGAPPAMTRRDDKLWRWFLNAESSDNLHADRDAPGHVARLAGEFAALVRVLAPGGLAAFVLRDIALPGRGTRLIPLAERIATTLQSQGVAVEDIHIIPLASSNRHAPTRLLVINQPDADSTEDSQ